VMSLVSNTNLLSNHKSVRYVVNSEPIGMPQRRHLESNTWNDMKQVKLTYEAQFTLQHDDAPLFDGPIAVDITFFFALPKNKTITSRHTKKPDLDDLVLFVLSTAQGTIFRSSSTIVSCISRKE
jgi:Holliday junction resolvase RusA-like endonuclease